MAKPIVSKVYNKESLVLWQQVDENVSEPALMIVPYDYVIAIEQEDRYIQINYDTIDELCKLLKSLKK